MNKNRIMDHPVLESLGNPKKITFTFDGKKYEGFEGDTIASALLANGIRKLRVQEATGNPRSIYCNIGHCFECRVAVNGKQGYRACVTLIEENMAVDSGQVLPHPLHPDVEDLPKTYADYAKNYKKGGNPNA
ncbi:(2Fe-2S)-binding protein [Ornithinibacillus sp. 4-3]|uniref:(2Fe-2S)-binding protein n=1 Tax=Ornithinibacillus sp. 4-3 TaxID=3231488 RepID=A0AB39HS60_9BACI